ncbi:MAG: serine/threonine-protein kinase [Nostocaceae cyanobacterium]|nr:serine/threonine-protein kinase [Nostocaceae cyanobacterium]
MLFGVAQEVCQGEKYTIEKVLGEGGFGITYLANDNKGNRFVIKTLNHRMQRGHKFAQRQEDFLNEALRLAKCAHPYIVQFYEVFQNDGLWCIVMEYIPGENLGSLINKRGALSESEALIYIKQIGAALIHCHSKHVLHRDVKPENIMLRKGKFGNNPPLEAVLIDFGMARKYTFDHVDSHTPICTPGFAPIEQYFETWKRGDYTDVYGLAATLYVCLTNTVPISAVERAEEVINRHKSDPLVPPKRLNPHISDRVNDAILSGMELEAHNRPQTVQEWLGLLPQKPSVTDVQLPSNVPNDLLTRNPIHPEVREVISNQDLSTKHWVSHPAAPLVPSLPADDLNGDDLSSSVNINYRRLRDLLAAKKWQAADEETLAVMLKVSGREKEGWLDIASINNFPATDLGTIDRLWVKYSDGRFGFSVQKGIWQSVGGKRNADYSIYAKFGDRVGWRLDNHWLSYSELCFTTDAPLGHLPSPTTAKLSGFVGTHHVIFQLHYMGLFSRIAARKS